jgi:hypothetical protein
MKVIIPVSSQNLPKILPLIKVIERLAPYQQDDKFIFLTSPSKKGELWPLISHLPYASTEVALSGTLRQFPLNANELFLECARYAAKTLAPDQPWLYLTGECLPLKQGWLTQLERQYLSQSKPFLGKLDYIPQKITDSQGVTRVHFGEPYTLETAIYPQDTAKRLTVNLLNRNTHHEQIRRGTIVPHTCSTELIASAKWAEKFSLFEVPEEAVLLVRVYDDSPARQLLTNTPVPIPVPMAPAPAATPVAAPPPPPPMAAPSLPPGTYTDSSGRIHLGGNRPLSETLTANQPTQSEPEPAAEPETPTVEEKAEAEHADLEKSPQAVMVIGKKPGRPAKKKK